MDHIDATLTATFDDDAVFDLLRGLAALTGSPIVGDLARLVGAAPRADLSIAFNHKQIGSKFWLRDALVEANDIADAHALIVGGWVGVLSALLLNDPRARIARATSVDLDPSCAEAATILNQRFADLDRFQAISADMYQLDYARIGADWVVNTSCEHIADLRGWLDLLPSGTRVVLQSNDYRREPDHVACVDSLDELEAQARLSSIAFRGERPTKNYRRFMLIGRS